MNIANFAVLGPTDDCTKVITPERHASDEFSILLYIIILFNIVIFSLSENIYGRFPKCWGNLVFVRAGVSQFFFFTDWWALRIMNLLIHLQFQKAQMIFTVTI